MSDCDSLLPLSTLELSLLEKGRDLDIPELLNGFHTGKKSKKTKKKGKSKLPAIASLLKVGDASETYTFMSSADQLGDYTSSHKFLAQQQQQHHKNRKRATKLVAEIKEGEPLLPFILSNGCEFKDVMVDWQNDSELDEMEMDNVDMNGDGSSSSYYNNSHHLNNGNGLSIGQPSSLSYGTISSNSRSNGFEEDGDGDDPDEEEDEVDHQLQADDELDLDGDDTTAHKTFKERAAELMKKTQGEHSHLVRRTLNSDDWLFMHRIIRKSKGLKSKFMMKNLGPYLFDSGFVSGWCCQHCKEMIPTPVKNYVDHLLTNHDLKDDDDPLFPCDICGDYVKKDKYVVHWVPHLMEHTCPICKKTFALNCHMKYHYKVVHEEGEQTCLQCGKLMKNDLAMRRHLRLFHSNRTNWKVCDICGKCVKSRCLEPHKLTHSQDRPFRCDICKKCFKTPSTLYQHQKVHATDSRAHKYLCEYCGKRFKHHTSWNLHVVRIHEGEYEHECPVCRKRFHKLFELKKHSVKHSEDRPFPCSTCGKHFKTKTHLKEHVTIHSNEKNHICPLCGKGIRMKANLYKHLKVHRNRGEYVPPMNMSSNCSYGSSLQSVENSNCVNPGSTTTSTTLCSKSSSPIAETDVVKELAQENISCILDSLPEKLDSPISQDIDLPSKSTLENFELLMSADESSQAQLSQSHLLVLGNPHQDQLDINSSSILPLNLNLSTSTTDLSNTSIKQSTNNNCKQFEGNSLEQLSVDDLLLSNNSNSNEDLQQVNHDSPSPHHHHTIITQNTNNSTMINHPDNNDNSNTTTTNINNTNINQGTTLNITLPSNSSAFPTSLLSLIAAAAQSEGFRLGNSLTHLTIMVNHNHAPNYLNNCNNHSVVTTTNPFVTANDMNNLPILTSNNYNNNNNNSVANNHIDSNFFLSQCMNNNTITTNINTLLNHIESQNNMQTSEQVSSLIGDQSDGNLQLNANPTTLSLTYHPSS